MVGGVLGNNKNGRFIYESLLNAKNSKIIALTGTPVQKDQYELALLLNILRGNIEITQFAISGGSYDINDINNFKEDLKKLDFIDYLDVNLKGKNIELHLTIKSWSSEYQTVLNKIKEISLENNTSKL